MTKLKIRTLTDERPVKLGIELPAAVHRDLLAYAEAVASESGQPVGDPGKLVAPMLARFMAADRGFAKFRRAACLAAADQVAKKTVNRREEGGSSD